ATVTEYLPGKSSGTVKNPSPFVAVDLSTLVASFFTTTVAPATTPPFGSTTVPRRVPVTTWAVADDEKTKTKVMRNSVDAAREASRFAIGELLISSSYGLGLRIECYLADSKRKGTQRTTQRYAKQSLRSLRKPLRSCVYHRLIVTPESSLGPTAASPSVCE